jgi:hypothetical protein
MTSQGDRCIQAGLNRKHLIGRSKFSHPLTEMIEQKLIKVGPKPTDFFVGAAGINSVA